MLNKFLNYIEFKKRFISFLWSLGGMAVAAVLAFLADNLNLLHVPEPVIVMLGLVIAQTTKIANNFFQGKLG